MESVQTAHILLLPAIPFMTAVAVIAAGKNTSVRDGLTVVGALATFCAFLYLLPGILYGTYPSCELFTLYPGIHVRFCLDGLGALFAGTASLLWALASFYCIGYMRSLNEHAQSRFYVCYAVSVGAALGAACSGNFFTLFLFYEVITLFTYPLVMHHQDREGYSGGRKYIVYLMFASEALLLPAIAIIYTQCGTLDFNHADIASGVFPQGCSRILVTASYVMCLFGFAKAAVMPLHSWLPAAMVAPTPVSALLHAVVVVKVGVFSICRVMLSVYGTALLEQLNLGLVTAYIVSFTILAASIIAMTQNDLKARLAYSTVSQLSYILLGVSLLSKSGIIGGLIHIPNHAVSKITLFFCAGVVYSMTGKKSIRDMGGLFWRLPWTWTAFGVAVLSMIGVPPVSGFLTKWYLARGTLESGGLFFLAVILISSLLNAVYFGEVVLQAFYGKPPAAPGVECVQPEKRFLQRCMIVPLVVTALLSVVFGLYPDIFLKLINLQVG